MVYEIQTIIRLMIETWMIVLWMIVSYPPVGSNPYALAILSFEEEDHIWRHLRVSGDEAFPIHLVKRSCHVDRCKGTLVDLSLES